MRMFSSMPTWPPATNGSRSDAPLQRQPTERSRVLLRALIESLFVRADLKRILAYRQKVVADRFR